MTEKRTEIERWAVYHAQSETWEDRAPDGKWVLYDDHRAALEAVEADLTHERAEYRRLTDEGLEAIAKFERRAEQAEKQLEDLTDRGWRAFADRTKEAEGERNDARKQLEELREAVREKLEDWSEHTLRKKELRVAEVLDLLTTQPDTASEAPRCGGCGRPKFRDSQGVWRCCKGTGEKEWRNKGEGEGR